MVEAKAPKSGNDDDDVFVATGRRTARDRAWGVIFGIGALFSVSNHHHRKHIYRFFVSLFFCPILSFLSRGL